MVCSRCLTAVKRDLESLGIDVIDLQLGKVRIKFPKGKVTMHKIEEKLRTDNFEIIKDQNTHISELIKLSLISLVNNLPITHSEKLSSIISGNLDRDYCSLSKIFSKSQHITIEQYFIKLRIEKAKELIKYEQLNFSEIAYDLGYNSVAHLSKQFKRITGHSMSDFKCQVEPLRTPQDKII